MSLLKKIGKVVKKVAGVASNFIPGPIGTVARAVTKVAAGAGAVTAGGAVIRAGSRLPPLPPVRSLPGIGRVGGGGGIIRSAAGTAAGVAIYDAAGNLIGTRAPRKRMNPLNHRALSRALRRVEAAKRMTKRLNAITIRKKDC